jgi:hypothetical protein
MKKPRILLRKNNSITDQPCPFTGKTFVAGWPLAFFLDSGTTDYGPAVSPEAALEQSFTMDLESFKDRVHLAGQGIRSGLPSRKECEASQRKYEEETGCVF